jgi:CHAT domain-containing protein
MSADKELKILQECVRSQCSRAVDVLTVIGDEKPHLFGDALRKALEAQLVDGHFDIFHFAGHSISFGPNKGTYLIFPGEHGTADAVPIERIADWVSRGGCHLIVLSSCEGASVLTAMEAMRCGAEGVIGFRWIVDDQLCVNYFKRFYESYLKEGHSYSVSFRDACNEVSEEVNKLPTWASAVAVLRD